MTPPPEPTGSEDAVEGPRRTGDQILALMSPSRSKPFRRFPRLVVQALRITWRAARRPFLVAAVLQFGGGIAVGAQLLVARWLLEDVIGQEGEGDFAGIIVPLVLLAAVTTMISFTEQARREHQRLVGELTGRAATSEVLSVATEVDLVSFEVPGFHDRLRRASVNASARPAQMASAVMGLTSSVFAIAGVGAALLVIQPLFLLIILVAYVPTWLVGMWTSRMSYSFELRQTERDRRRMYLFRTLVGKDEAQEIRGFGLGEYLRNRHDRHFDDRIADLRDVVRRRIRAGLLGTILTSTLTALAVGYLVWQVTTGRLSVASAGAAAGAVLLLGQRLTTFAGSASLLFESSLFIEDFTSFVESMPAVVAARPTGVPPRGFSKLEARGVTFTYPASHHAVIRDIDLEIRRGEVVALVGENGSGKTTLAKQLGGLFRPDAGTIMWDGVDVTECDPVQVRDHVAIVFQDFVRYLLTARENVGMGRHELVDDLAAVEAAARRAGAHDLLAGLPAGYESQLGPEFFGGIDVSGGEWQRIALARAFLRDAPFVILDEPTAALDPRAEADLFERIGELLSGRAVLLISHRFSSVRSADRIYVMRGGRIVESGNHGELMATAGLYAELFSLQAAAYLKEVATARPTDVSDVRDGRHGTVR